MQTECTSSRRRCPGNGRCVPSRYFCDGDDDCGDMSDENADECRELQMISIVKTRRNATPFSAIAGFRRCVPPASMFMPPPTIAGAEHHHVLGSSVRPLSVNTYSAFRDISSLSGRIE